jgi:hypothetical protein
MRSDNGGEYVNRPFEEYLLRFVIEWSRFLTHLSQHGIAEYKNKMSVEIARCIFLDKDLPPHFKYEAMYCENYLLNHIST